MMPVLKTEAAESHTDGSMLPKLPVPELQQTLNSYLRSVQHLVSETQFHKTKAMVEAFSKQGGVGGKLQKRLLEKREKTDNWVYDVWLEDMYLKSRLALPVNSSPALVFPKQAFRDRGDCLTFAACLILSVSQYKTAVDGQTLPVDAARGQQAEAPLCMDQYKRLFSSYRRPGLKQDSLITADPSPGAAGHVIVACKSQFFVLDLMEGTRTLNEAEVQAQLERICEESLNVEQKQPAVGLLTSDGRTEWARARDELLKDAVSRRSLELMESCVCVLCLDEPAGLEPSAADRASMMLHGGGPERNGANRWYDKALQFVVGADGVCGVVCEHSPFEGIVAVQCAEDILKHTCSSSSKHSSGRSTADLPRPRRLQWKCSPGIEELLTSAEDHLQRLVKNLHMNVFVFPAYGKDLIKQQRMSPDAFIQLALQLAFYRTHRRAVSTYESASLRRFRRGRVDNIRSATREALLFSKAMSDAGASVQEKMEKLRSAADAQAQITLMAVTGNGIDNHLLGLREMAKEMEMDMPDLFSDKTYQISNRFILSTSQVPTAMEMFCCYGPVVVDGYGVCYNPQADHIVFCVSSFRESKETCSEQLVKELDAALLDMKALCIPHTEHTNTAKQASA